jgi:glycosyltransferase involved in cell wall biosynthesis
MRNNGNRIGFVSTRLAGTDGVTLETHKWVNVLERLGYECYYFAGECDCPTERSRVVPEAHFKHPDILALNADLFEKYVRSSETSGKIQSLRFFLKKHLYDFIEKYEIDLLITENILSIPMNIPLGLAVTELIAETEIPTIAHHHDFGWERPRFKVSAASDYQLGAFPPILRSVRHVVINSHAARQLALRTGASSTQIPNVMDFDNPTPDPDGYGSDLRQALGMGSDEYLLLQPTRVVPRKRIEMAIELARRLGLPCSLIISHAAGDEGNGYASYLQEHAESVGVRLVFADDILRYRRGTTPDGQKIYSLADIYHQADLVTYPSTIEGFGNAFLEAIYYKQPIFMSTYEIFRTDIQPKGFQVIGFSDFVNRDIVNQARALLENPEEKRRMVEHNYELGRRYYSYRSLEARLKVLLDECRAMSPA